MGQVQRLSWAGFALVIFSAHAGAQQQPLAAPPARTMTTAQLKSISSFDGQLVQINALVRHTDTAQLFTFGEKQGPQVHVLVPHPAIDAANVGDTVAVLGFVRRYSTDDFERDYSWFRRVDYKDLKSGDWVIVATSVRSPDGTELVPPGVISNTTAVGKAP